jgi:hypothetical protein
LRHKPPLQPEIIPLLFEPIQRSASPSETAMPSATPLRCGKRNPIFVRGEVTRLALAVLREATEPLAVAEGRTGYWPGMGYRSAGSDDHTFAASGNLQCFGDRGVVRIVGVGNEAKRTGYG